MYVPEHPLCPTYDRTDERTNDQQTLEGEIHHGMHGIMYGWYTLYVSILYTPYLRNNAPRTGLKKMFYPIKFNTGDIYLQVTKFKQQFKVFK